MGLEDTQMDQIYARAMSVDEHDLVVSDGVILPREWVLCNEEIGMGSYGFFESYETAEAPPRGTHSLWFLKSKWVDPGVRRSGGDSFEIIVAVRAKLDEFSKGGAYPIRYVNKQDIPLDRVQLIYDPGGVIHGSRIDLPDLTCPMANAKPLKTCLGRTSKTKERSLTLF